MRRRIGIIGTGWVGASVAISTLHSGIADELLLNDRRSEVAEGEALDLAHGASFYPPSVVRTSTVEDMCDCDAVVVTAGRGGRPGESRLELLRDNAAVIRDIGAALAGCRGIIVVVSNPVDVLTRVMTMASGLPAARVVGTGTMLDSARLRQTLARVLHVDSHSVHAQVIGEHGDSEVVLWSSATAGGVRIRDWPQWNRDREPRIAHDVRRAAYEIIQRKGATNHAIGLVTADLLRCMLRDERRILTVCRVQQETSGLEDVALSLPAIVSADGAATVIHPLLDSDEGAALERSATVLRDAGASLGDGKPAVLPPD
jgi:L-lactate dehydrogenase